MSIPEEGKDMSTASFQSDNTEQDRASMPLNLGDANAEEPQAWELIENGRYMPRRIRGSCLGRELG
jgi:hypothetical protein